MIEEEITDKPVESQNAQAEEPAAGKATNGAKPQSQNDYSFNWESAGNNKGEYSPEERKRMEEIYDHTLHLVEEHQIVDGTVVSIGSKDVLVNIGYKSDGLVPLA